MSIPDRILSRGGMGPILEAQTGFSGSSPVSRLLHEEVQVPPAFLIVSSLCGALPIDHSGPLACVVDELLAAGSKSVSGVAEQAGGAVQLGRRSCEVGSGIDRSGSDSVIAGVTRL